MEAGLKILHYFSILFAGGVMVGSTVVQSAYARAGEMPPPFVGTAFALLGYIGLASIVTLWVTGIGLAHMLYGGLGINGAFHVKLLGAAVVLGRARGGATWTGASTPASSCAADSKSRRNG